MAETFTLLGRMILFVVFGLSGTVLWFVSVFVVSKFDKDPTASGAYFGLTAVLSPIAFLVCGTIGLVWTLWWCNSAK